MAGESARCGSCGAAAPRVEARFCEHCGARLASEPVAAAPDPFGDLPARFRALAAHPELAPHLAARPEVPELGGKLLPSLFLLAGLALLGVFVTLLCFQICPPLGFVPLALVGVSILVIVRQLHWNASTPLVARPAMVVGLRTKLQAGARHSSSNARHFATLRFEDGETRELECFASALAALAPGVMGVAYLKGERLAALVRFAL